MAKPENDENYPWSTWEELLLACAVHRHGTDSWDSVAAEIHKQNSSSRTLTAVDCRHKYHDLKRRFSPAEGETVSKISSVPWLEELRKLRVDELRREVERYDLSISSLQLKVKRLEDEREKSLKETETSDLHQLAETKHSHRDSGINSDVPVTEPPISPDPKDNDCPGTGSENTTRGRKIAEPLEDKPNRIGGDDNHDKPAREDSGRGSCESVANESDRAEPLREGNDSPEFVESMCESKEAKETSDVQSSASLPRKETAEHDQPDNEDQSLTVNKTPVESRPLIDFIEILRSHPIGSHFSRRLESQETPEYERIIRQHVDFELIRTRADEGYYQSSKSKFFRDLLLLINNARVFYGERSSEFNSAKQLNQLIKKQMTLNMSSQTSPPKQESKEEVTVSSPPLSLKPKMSVSIKACRKRSSLAVGSSASATEPFKKKTKIVPTMDEKKPVSESEGEDGTSDKDEEPILSKKIPRGRTTSAAKKVGSRNVRTSLDDGLPSKGRSSNDSSEQKKSDQEKKGNSTGSSKKQSAASFLKRMKGASSSETFLETVKADSSNGKRGAEQRKSNSKNEKDDAGKPSAGQKRATGMKPTVEKGSIAKKNTSAASKREASVKEEGSSDRPKKRTRRL